MLQLLSGNQALAHGAHQAGIKVATAYPGTPSSEILETIAHYNDIYAEWSTNEKVALEVAMGASYAGIRSMTSMKHVGLNVASDPFMAVSTTGVNGALVIISADDPGMHSSQNEQDNRYYAKLAKVPMLEPSDSQEAYDFLAYAVDISERFDTPVLIRVTTRISHSKSIVNVQEKQRPTTNKPFFNYDFQKLVMLPVNARLRHPIVETRLTKLAEFAEKFPQNYIIHGKSNLGIITSGVAYQYAREAFPDASFLKLGLTYPLPNKLIHQFATQYDELLVVEELEPFLEEHIRAMGLKISGKEKIPRVGELTTDIVEKAGRNYGYYSLNKSLHNTNVVTDLPKRPPLLCSGCPHTALFFVLSNIGRRLKSPKIKNNTREPGLIITGDIGCYTLAAYPPLAAMDTCACMGASIGQALGIAKANNKRVVAVIGDSTFMHSGITGVVDAVYNQGSITIIILDNSTTAMTGHQEHPGTGISAQGQPTQKVNLEHLITGAGVEDVKVVDAFKVKELRNAVRKSITNPTLSVLIVRGDCPMNTRVKAEPKVIDLSRCNGCDICLLLGCPAIQKEAARYRIDSNLCRGDACTICQQICPKQAIVDHNKIKEIA